MLSEKDGFTPSIQCLPSSTLSVVTRYGAGIITSVSILSPNFQTRPSIVIAYPIATEVKWPPAKREASFFPSI